MFCILSTTAQQTENLRFERFTLENGLVSDRVKSIAQDQKGYIWIGTASGLSRFDGYEFISYRNKPGDPRSIANNRVNVVFADKLGNIWSGTQNGLSLFDPLNEEFRNFFHIPGNVNSIPGNVVSTIYESTSGQLWIGTDNGLAELERDSGVIVSQWHSGSDYVSLQGVNIRSISEDQNGRLWMGTSNQGLITFDISKKTFQFLNEQNTSGLLIPSMNVSKVLVASSGDIWIGFLPEFGVVRYNPDKKTSERFTYNEKNQPHFWNIVSDIIETADKAIWVTTINESEKSGLHKFDYKSNLFSRYAFQPYNSSSLTWSYCETVFEDKDNNLWIGTSRGLNKADLNRWQIGMMNVNPQYPNHLENSFYGIAEIEKDIFWIGLDEYGFIEWDRKTNETKKIDRNDPRFGNGIACIIRKDHDGMIWFGYKGQGCARYNPQTGELDKFLNEPGNPKSLPGNYVADILIDRMNNIWIATSNGLSRFNNEQGNFTNWQKDVNTNEMSGNALSSLFEDSRGNIWIGTNQEDYDPNVTYPSGLMKFAPERNHFKSYKSDPNDPGSLSSNVVFIVNEDLNGNIWVGTNNGLNKLDANEEKFEVFLNSDGLPDPNIIGILVDNEGKLWLSTLKGISQFDPVNKSFRNFTLEDGIQAYRFNYNSQLKTSNGELIFGGVLGANYFYPSDISSKKVIPEVHITRFLVQNQPQRFEKTPYTKNKINLNWKENSIGFEFVAINFRASLHTQYEYMLEGFDNEWNQSGTRRYVNYTNLPSGNYTFRVRAINAENVYSNQDAAINIEIRPPFWRTWWAYIIYGFMFIFLAIIVNRNQRQRLIRKERERVKDQELKHAKEIEKAYAELKSTQSQLIQSEKLASLGALTAGIAHEIQNPLNFVNNFAEVSTELVDEMNDELDKGFIEEVKEISNDIKQNLEKINHHGKRAESIVKGMLLHSRGSSGHKEPVDINALADEYLRLSYHGFRAKDKSLSDGQAGFHAEYKTDLDPSLPKINVVPQDIGRVLLNLINNAFYAVNMRRNTIVKTTHALSQTSPPYNPTVTVTTKNLGNRVEISVKDNGPGIPEAIKDKIFQPFFTTKPTGQGTGLGLSLAYDIVKAHGGEIRVETIEGEGAEFAIQLPIII
jgi:signal transduction histidine kinase/ligand-binding sensor domain-containing protein